MPTVMPLWIEATASSRVVLLSLIDPPVVPCAARVGPSLLPAESLGSLVRSGERVAMLVGHAGEVELERKALLHAVGGVHLLDVDEVQRFLGRADDPCVLRGDVSCHA